MAIIRRHQITGHFFDIGGGNGCVAKAIESAGVPVVLVEPGTGGVRNARSRGLVWEQVPHVAENQGMWVGLIAWSDGAYRLTARKERIG